MKKIVVLVALLMTVSTAHSALIVGAGSDSCGTWTKVMKEDSIQKNTYTQWLLGYMSASDIFTSTELLEGGDPEGWEGYVDKYCAENPQKSVQRAADELGFVLLSKKKK